MYNKIHSFKDLEAWKQAHLLVLMIYGSIQENREREFTVEFNADMPSSKTKGNPDRKVVGGRHKETSSFPRYELYSLTDQIRRAVVSISSNIAEGFSRTTKNEKVRFYNIAFGSLLEIQNQTQIARDLNYISPTVFNNIEAQIIVVQKLINGLIKSSKSK